MLVENSLATQILLLLNQMRSQAETDNPMDDKAFADQLATIIHTYILSATVMIDTFAATTSLGSTIAGTATGRVM